MSTAFWKSAHRLRVSISPGFEIPTRFDQTCLHVPGLLFRHVLCFAYDHLRLLFANGRRHSFEPYHSETSSIHIAARSASSCLFRSLCFEYRDFCSIHFRSAWFSLFRCHSIVFTLLCSLHFKIPRNRRPSHFVISQSWRYSKQRKLPFELSPSFSNKNNFWFCFYNQMASLKLRS